MPKKIFLPILIFVLLLAVGLVGYLTSNNNTANNEFQIVQVQQTTPLRPQEDNEEREESELDILYSKYGEFTQLTIPYLQSRQYVGSNITIKQTLNTSSNYVSYIASYKSDGLEINGLLTKPNTTEPAQGFPAVVFLHGYIPPSQYVTTQKYEAYVDYLARRGFVVYKIDYRGHGNSEGEPGGAYFSSDYIIDTLNAVQSLKTLDFVNESSISLWGHSMSGNVALRSVAAKPDLINRAVIWAGAGFTYKDFFEYRISDNSYVRPNPNPNATPSVSRRVRESLGDFEQNMDYWNYVAPINYLDSSTPPIQLHHAINDTVVTIEYSRNLQQILDQRGVNNEFYEYAVGGHNINSPAFEQAMQRTVQFLGSN